MELVYSKAYQKFQNQEYFDVTNLQYIFSEETLAKWMNQKSACKKKYSEQLERVLHKDTIKEMFLKILQSCHESMEESYTWKTWYMELMQ